MSAASPFGQSMVETFEPKVTQWGEVYPSWYRRSPHTEEELHNLVTQEGVPLVPQIRVGDVVETRRWAIGSDGELLPQHIFERKIEDWHLEFFKAVGQGKGHFRAHLEHKPMIRRFVADVEHDPMYPGRLRKRSMPVEPSATPVEAGKFYSAEKDEWVDKLDSLVEAYHNPRFKQKMTAEEIRRVEEHLGATQAQDPVAAAAAKLAAGLITLEQFQAETGTAPAVVETAPEKPKRKGMSDEQRKAASERMKAMHAKKRAEKEAAAAQEA